MKKEIILKLIELYCYVSAIYDSRLAYSVQRFSNNCSPKFTDQEIMTIYLWATLQKQYTKKDVYKYAINHLTEYFLTPYVHHACQWSNWHHGINMRNHAFLLNPSDR